MPHVELPQAEFKVVLLGDTNTGKTSLALRFVEGYYKDGGTSSTVGAFFLTKRITLHQTTSCKLLLWDTAGQAQFQKLAKTYYQQAAAAILTYDVSQPQSLHRLRGFLAEAEQNTTGRRMVFAIVACKTDLDKSLHHPGLQEEAATLAAAHGALYIATSAKMNEGVQSLFEQTAERVLQYKKEADAGMGLPIPVAVGETSKLSYQRSRSLDRSFSPRTIMPRVVSSYSQVGTPPPKDIVDASHSQSQTSDLQTDDSSNDQSDNVVDEESAQPESRNPFMCDEGLFSCAIVPDRGCYIM
jgi:small GTP-binding protein